MNDDAIITLVVIGILFGFVLPLWLALHYSSRRRRDEPAVPAQGAQLQRLAQTAERLQKRVQALESILDAEHPGWRNVHDR